MVTINGQKMALDGVALSEFLKRYGYSPTRVAVERNGEIVPKARYEDTVFADGDVIEIVSFVGGG